jgi:hypothetical protein
MITFKSILAFIAASHHLPAALTRTLRLRPPSLRRQRPGMCVESVDVCGLRMLPGKIDKGTRRGALELDWGLDNLRLARWAYKVVKGQKSGNKRYQVLVKNDCKSEKCKVPNSNVELRKGIQF